MRDAAKEYAIPFAAWELRLYLNTHPGDERALELYKGLCRQLDAHSYAVVADEFLDDCRWTWIDGPWPWEAEANCKWEV